MYFIFYIWIACIYGVHSIAGRLFTLNSSRMFNFDTSVWGLSSHPRIFHSYGDVSTIPVKGCKFTYARHSWPLSSEDSLASHTYCDTGHPRTRDTHTYCLALSSGAVTTCFYDLGLLGWDSNTTFHLRGLLHRRGLHEEKDYFYPN